MTAIMKTIRNKLTRRSMNFALPYIGDSPHLEDTFARVRLKRVGGKMSKDVACPFCENPTEPVSLSGKRREMSEERRRCPMGHGISLISKTGGGMGWK